MDSQVRTGDCIWKKEPDSEYIEIHFGYTFLTAFFRRVRYEDDYMSASFRTLNNSIKFTYDFHNGTECHVSLGINYERMSDVMLGSSNPKLDIFLSPVLDAFFQKNVIPVMNKRINTDLDKLENLLQLHLCKGQRPGNKLFDLTDFKKVFENVLLSIVH